MPSKVEEPARTKSVLLIQAEWPARALLMAELEARGCSVCAVGSLSDGIRWMSVAGFAPSAIVVDSNDLDIDAGTTDLESLLSGRPTPALILLSSTQLSPPESFARRASRTLIRPLTIGEIADAVVQS